MTFLLRKLTIAIVVLVSLQGVLPAIDVKGVDVHGSFSQTFLKMNRNDYLMEGAREGSFEWTEFLLNASKDIENFSLGAQLIVRDFGEEGDFRAELDWGIVDYMFNDNIGLRLGRARQPFGMYNEYRDADAGRVEILFPQGFNSEGYRAGATSYDGGAIHGSIDMKAHGTLDYQIFGGKNHIEDDFFLPLGINNAFGARNTSMNTHRLGGVQLSWYLPQPGWRVSYTGFKYEGSFDINGIPHPLLGKVSFEKAIEFNINWNVLGVEYHDEKWFISSEISLRDNHNPYSDGMIRTLLLDDFFIDYTSFTYYLTVRRYLNDEWSVYASFGEDIRYAFDANSAPGETLEEFNLGFRYDPLPNVTLKMQGFLYKGTKGLETAAQPSPPQATLDEYSSMVVSRLTLHF